MGVPTHLSLPPICRAHSHTVSIPFACMVHMHMWGAVRDTCATCATRAAVGWEADIDPHERVAEEPVSRVLVRPSPVRQRAAALAGRTCMGGRAWYLASRDAAACAAKHDACCPPSGLV